MLLSIKQTSSVFCNFSLNTNCSMPVSLSLKKIAFSCEFPLDIKLWNPMKIHFTETQNWECDVSINSSPYNTFSVVLQSSICVYCVWSQSSGCHFCQIFLKFGVLIHFCKCLERFVSHTKMWKLKTDFCQPFLFLWYVYFLNIFCIY